MILKVDLQRFKIIRNSYFLSVSTLCYRILYVHDYNWQDYHESSSLVGHMLFKMVDQSLNVINR